MWLELGVEEKYHKTENETRMQYRPLAPIIMTLQLSFAAESILPRFDVDREGYQISKTQTKKMDAFTI